MFELQVKTFTVNSGMHELMNLWNAWVNEFVWIKIDYWSLEFWIDQLPWQLIKVKLWLDRYSSIKNVHLIEALSWNLTQERHLSANGCLLPLCAVDGMAVTTVEGIGSTKTALHPVQVNKFKCICDMWHTCMLWCMYDVMHIFNLC